MSSFWGPLQVWTRISTADLGGDNGQMVMWINPRQDGAIQVNEDTARIFRDILFRFIRDGGQGEAINSMVNGILRDVLLPESLNPAGGPEVRFVRQDALDLSEIEIRIFQSPEEWQEFARNYPEYAVKVFSSTFGRSGVGGCLMPREGGGSLLAIPYFLWDSIFAGIWTGDKPFGGASTIEEARAGELGFSDWLFISLATIAYPQEGENASIVARSADKTYPMRQMMEGMFDYLPDGFVENHNIDFD